MNSSAKNQRLVKQTETTLKQQDEINRHLEEKYKKSKEHLKTLKKMLDDKDNQLQGQLKSKTEFLKKVADKDSV